ncbi:hypothetical protein D770_01510 [Flammeovirgaceae bacterium 311]|nr:hypothetical protein D770_01510 [Flammeovirgaceae bacterium 311]
MKTIKNILGVLISGALLLSCDSSTTNQETPSDIVTENRVEQLEQLQEEPVGNTGADDEENSTPKFEVVAQNLQFSPKELQVKAGQRIQVTLVNRGDVDYSLKFELPDGEQELRTPVPPGRRAGLVFTAPEKPGTYSFFSPLQNHRGRGMVGTLVVE